MIKILTPGGYSLFMERDMLTENGTVSGDEMMVYIYSSKHYPSDLRLIVTTRSQENTESILGLFKRTIILTGGITLFAAGLIGFIIVWRQIRPLNTIIERLKKSTGEGQSRRLEVNRTDEVGELAEALNRLFDQTEKHIIDERQVTSDISHELRTPLAIVQAEASLALTRDRYPDEYRKILENISREIFHLSSLVDKLLFLARPDKNYDLEMNTFNLQELLEEIISNAHVMCELKDQNFSYIAENSINSCTITADFTRLRELFLNLIDNAVCYTAPGGDITLTAKRENGEATISVLDTGIGIEEKHIPFLFNRFFRVHNSQKQSKAGTGLGLAICRRIVQLHGGTIYVQSKPGEGSTFIVSLPIIN
jgi:signal transduction histidine kinase